MDKYSYYVIEEKHTSETRLLYHARAERIHNSNNLLCALTRSHTSNMQVISANACDTWKEAKDIAAYWNQCFVDNGTSYIEWLKGATA